MTRIHNQNGLTLAEVLVSGSVSSVIAGMVLTVFTAETSVVNEGVTIARLLSHAQLVADAIELDVRQSSSVLSAGELWSAGEPGGDSAVTKQIRLYDTAGVVTAAYRINGSVLEQSSDCSNWRPFVVGFYAVNVTDKSGFVLMAGRKQVYLDFTLVSKYKGRDYTLPIAGSMFRCRN